MNELLYCNKSVFLSKHKFPFDEGLWSDSLGSILWFQNYCTLTGYFFLWQKIASSKMTFLGQIFLPVAAIFLLVTGVCLFYPENLFFCQVIFCCDRNTFPLAGNDNILLLLSFHKNYLPVNGNSFQIATLKRVNF